MALQVAEPFLIIQESTCITVGACISIKRVLGFTEVEARHELAQWLGHNPHRTEVTYAYVPKLKGM